MRLRRPVSKPAVRAEGDVISAPLFDLLSIVCPGREQIGAGHSCRRDLLNDSITAGSIGFSGLEKSIVTRWSLAHLSKTREINPLLSSYQTRSGPLALPLAKLS